MQRTRITMDLLRKHKNKKATGFEEEKYILNAMSGWAKDRARAAISPFPKKAIMMTVTELVVIMRRLLSTFSSDPKEQRRIDCCWMALVIAGNSGCRTQDVCHLLPQDIKIVPGAEGARVLSCCLRYSKSNRLGKKHSLLQMYERPVNPFVCPVTMWLEFKRRNRLIPDLSIMQRHDVPTD